MQETRNNCFGSKKRSSNVTVTVAVTATCYYYISALVLNCFRLKKGRATIFRPETIVASFLHSMVLLPKVLFNHKRQSLFYKFLNLLNDLNAFRTAYVSLDLNSVFIK